MIWAVQDSITWSALENNVKPLLKTLSDLNRQFVNIGYASDEKTITGIDGLDISHPTMFYGSTKLAEIAATSKFKPGSFFNNTWWDPTLWKHNRNDMLNQTIYSRTIGDLRANWITEERFIKPTGAKTFAGQVIEVEEYEGWFDEYGIVLKDDLEICCSPVQKIEREWRFFVVDGQVVTGSQYKKYGLWIIKEPISSAIYKLAQQFADKWLPNPTIVMDICELWNGEYKVIEFNSVNSSGFYNCDISKIVVALEDKYNG